MDINAAIDAYSYQGGNRIGLLRDLCPNDTFAAETLATEISGLQNQILDLVRFRSGPEGLTMSQIEQSSQEYLASSRRDVNEIGLHGLMRYVLWIAYHDGWLKR